MRTNPFADVTDNLVIWICKMHQSRSDFSLAKQRDGRTSHVLHPVRIPQIFKFAFCTRPRMTPSSCVAACLWCLSLAPAHHMHTEEGGVPVKWRRVQQRLNTNRYEICTEARWARPLLSAHVRAFQHDKWAPLDEELRRLTVSKRNHSSDLALVFLESSSPTAAEGFIPFVNLFRFVFAVGGIYCHSGHCFVFLHVFRFMFQLTDWHSEWLPKEKFIFLSRPRHMMWSGFRLSSAIFFPLLSPLVPCGIWGILGYLSLSEVFGGTFH